MKYFLLLLFFSINTIAANRQDLKSNLVGIGLNDTLNKILEFNAASGTARMKIRANYSTSTLQYSENGATYQNFGSAIPAYTYSLKTASYAAVIGDYISVSGSALTVSMPTAVGNIGKTIVISNLSTSTTAVVSVTTQVSSQLIGGVTSATNILRNETLSFISDGTNWQYFENDKKERNYRILFGGAGTRYTSCTSSPCVIWTDSGGTVSVTRSSAGSYLINLVNGMFSEPPICTVAWNGGGTIFATAIGNSTTQVQITAFNTGTPSDGAFNVICRGPRP